MVKKVEYSRSMNQCNLIITAEEGNEIEKDSIEMFRYNQIPYFLNFHIQKKNNAVQFFYDITGMQPLEQVLEYRSLNYQFVKKLLESFDQACIQAANYMLTENDIALLPELLYLNTESEELRFCYLPGNQIHICVQFKKFVEYLMRHLDHKDKKAVQLVYGVYQQVAEEKNALHSVLQNAENEWNGQGHWNGQNVPIPDSQSNWSQSDSNSQNNWNHQSVSNSQDNWNHQSVLDSQNVLNSQNLRNGKPKNVRRKNTRQRKQRDIKPKNLKQRDLRQKNKKDQGRKKFVNFFRKKIYTDSYQKMEDETFFGDEPEVQLESPEQVYTAPNMDDLPNKFIYQGTDRNRDFACPQGKKVLGSSTKYADICIPFPMVSKIHAKIEVNENGTFLEDMNSTNGTQVNGETLKYREKRILQKGDTVSIAGENYRFC